VMTAWLRTVPAYFPARFFISYSSFDHNMVRTIQDSLVEAGHEVWRDRTSLRQGDYWKEEVEFAIQHCDEIVVLLTPKSAQSQPVKYELEFAIKNNKRVNLFATFDVNASRELYNIVSSVNYLRMDESEVTGAAVAGCLLPTQAAKHPVGIREFEWAAS